MAYRGDDAQDALEAPTAEGILKVTLGPNRADLAVGQRTLHVADRIATLVQHKKQKQERRASVKIAGNFVVARGYPRESIGIWVEHKDNNGMQRIFGVEPASLLDLEGLGNLAKLDGLFQRLRTHLADLAVGIRRAFEIGSGHALDKVLLLDYGDYYMIYARRLFRDRARFAMTVFQDGRIVVPDGKGTREVQVGGKFGVTVRGDYIRFADRHHIDVARVSFPWLARPDKDELARRIAQFMEG